MYYEVKDGMVHLRIKAQPGASKNAWCEVYGEDAIKVRIKAPAVEGAANKELIKFLSKTFKVPKGEIVLKSGQSSKVKLLVFPWTEAFKQWQEEIVE